MRARLQAPKNKPEFYRRYIKQEFGNRPRLWESLDELLASDYNGMVSIRSLVPGGKCLYRVPVDQLRRDRPSFHDAIFQQNVRACIREKATNKTPQLPDEYLTLQGSLSFDDLGVILEYSSERNKKFREATFTTLRGVRARHVLHQFLDPSSLADLFAMLDMYNQDKCVIEFAAYDVDVGVIPNRNWVIFEVRAY
jgi:hypothetical protein